ncbi:MAG: HTH domain-containing protein [Actinomycetota bacterium]
MYGRFSFMRAGRLLELVLLLQGGRRLTANELAERLEVSPRTILRDIETLSGSGVPVRSIRGPEGGFELLDGHGIDVDPDGPRLPAGNEPVRRARAAIRISPDGRRRAAVLGRLQPIRLRRGVPPDADGWVEATIRLTSMASTVADLLSLGGEVEVLTPTRLRHRMAAETEAMAARYADRSSPGTASGPTPRPTTND